MDVLNGETAWGGPLPASRVPTYSSDPLLGVNVGV